MGIELIIFTIITISLSAYAYTQRNKNGVAGPIAQKGNPTTVAQRGAWIPRLIGRGRLGATVVWATERRVIQEKRGHGESKYTAIVYYERGTHVICIGPAYKLWKIRRDGKKVWTGPITRDSHPSGTSVSTGELGDFEIYWGERDQAVNTTWGDRLGIDSAWPSYCYIHWPNVRLGEQPVWGDFDYEIEVRPEASALVDTEAWDVGTMVTSGVSYDIVSVTDAVSWPSTRATIVISGRRLNRYAPGNRFALAGNAASDQDLTVFSRSYDKVTNRTTITVLEDLTGTDSNGTVTNYLDAIDDGPNPAHILYEVLFGATPLGAGLDPAEFDISSLESIGTLMDTEGIRLALSVSDGEEILSVLGSLMQDMGVMMPFDVDTGLYKFVPIREVSIGSLVNVPEEMVLAPIPELTTSHQVRRMDGLEFAFNDRNRKFKENIYPIDDDAQSEREGSRRARSIELTTVIDWDTCAVVAERRALEEMTDQSSIKLMVNRDGVRMIPGTRFTCDEVPQLLMVSEVVYDQMSGRVELGCLLDFYGTTAATYSAPETGADESTEDNDSVQPMTAFDWQELPAFISDRTMKIIVLAIRESEDVLSANVYLSRDGSSYTIAGELVKFAFGGLLREELSASTTMLLESGPEFDVVGPDIDQVEDLSSDTESWRLGRQILIIGTEWMYLREVTYVSDGVYTLDGIIRGRLATVRQTHSIGTPVFILRSDNMEVFTDLLLQPDKDLYVIGQPVLESGESIDVDEINAVDATLVGLGIKPINPVNLRVVGCLNVYSTGQDIDFTWSYRSLQLPKTGAGMQSAGSASGTSDPEGEFTLEFLTSGDVSVLYVDAIPTNSYTLLNADLLAAFGSEPASFKVRLLNVNGGFSSDPLEITVEMT